ncbi:MAG: hypothetical protein IT292_10385 [Deltaproteobacteria bacterium]|nr:hypothetical protein [Deltaproteobacteria bacterium]
MMVEREYSAIEVRELIQKIFPQRKLVLSQFTFFNHVGVAKPSGETFRRGRRCYRLVDLLSVVTVLALKEQGIPLKNIDLVPSLIQENAQTIFNIGAGCRLSGHGSTVSLNLPNQNSANEALDSLLGGEMRKDILFWSYDVGLLARQLQEVAEQDLRQFSIAA